MQVTQYKKYTRVQIISLYCSHNTNNTQRFVCLFLPISNLIQPSWWRAIQKISCATQKYVGNLKFPKNGFAWNFTYLPEQASSAKQTALLCLECFGIGVNSVAASVCACLFVYASLRSVGLCLCVCVWDRGNRVAREYDMTAASECGYMRVCVYYARLYCLQCCQFRYFPAIKFRPDFQTIRFLNFFQA